MPDIHSVKEATVGGVDGFIIEWQMRGFSKSSAKFRAVGMTALRFPTTITSSEVVGVREFDPMDFNVQVFVPLEGFADAGIGQPVKWMREQFQERFME